MNCPKPGIIFRIDLDVAQHDSTFANTKDYQYFDASDITNTGSTRDRPHFQISQRKIQMFDLIAKSSRGSHQSLKSPFMKLMLHSNGDTFPKGNEIDFAGGRHIRILKTQGKVK